MAINKYFLISTLSFSLSDCLSCSLTNTHTHTHACMHTRTHRVCVWFWFLIHEHVINTAYRMGILCDLLWNKNYDLCKFCQNHFVKTHWLWQNLHNLYLKFLDNIYDIYIWHFTWIVPVRAGEKTSMVTHHSLPPSVICHHCVFHWTAEWHNKQLSMPKDME